jgi:hypothetical protein
VNNLPAAPSQKHVDIYGNNHLESRRSSFDREGTNHPSADVPAHITKILHTSHNITTLMASQLLPLELIDKCVGSRIWVIMKGDKGVSFWTCLRAISHSFQYQTDNICLCAHRV